MTAGVDNTEDTEDHGEGEEGAFGRQPLLAVVRASGPTQRVSVP